MLRVQPKYLLALIAVVLNDRSSGQTSGSLEKPAVTIDASKTRAPISPYLYGQFIELVLRKSKIYSGRVVLAGEPGAAVGVSLVWGTSPGDRQTGPIGSLQARYTKFPLKFTAGGDTDNGHIEVAGTGTGSFHIGSVSLMPADNRHGFRRDTNGLLKQLRSGMYRFPGGNFLSAHDWRDAIDDPDKRPPRWDYVWSALQPNYVGTDEFLALCELLGVEAFISVNAGFGDARSAANSSNM